MKILFVVPYAPTLIRVRPYNLIRALAQNGHQVTLVTLWTDPEEQAALGELRPVCEAVHALRLPRWLAVANSFRAAVTPRPLQSAYCWRPALLQLLVELIETAAAAKPFDAIHIEHLRGAEYGMHLERILREKGIKPRPPLIFDSVDCISLLFRQSARHSRRRVSRWISGFELKRTERYERRLPAAFDQILMTSPNDKAALLDLMSPQEASQHEAKISIVPNGVDLAYFTLDPGAKRDNDTVVVTGKMSYHANVTMVLNIVEKIMPRVWSARPGAKLQIVGKDPSSEIRALSGKAQITVTGTVPDIRPYLRGAAVAIAPITYGVGIQNKILEAMACGTPVVTTSPAMGALAARSGRDLLVADDSEACAEAILTLLDDRGLREDVGCAGRRYVETVHDWGQIAARLAEVYRAPGRSAT